MTVLLDASALLALLNEEKGAETVAEVIHDAAMSCVNAAEVAALFNENQYRWIFKNGFETLE